MTDDSLIIMSKISDVLEGEGVAEGEVEEERGEKEEG